MMNNTWRHPELGPGEMHLTNATPRDYEQIGHKTKRRGMVAYDINGKPVKSVYPFFPVFVKITEYNENAREHGLEEYCENVGDEQ